jgi:hypothetical protein
VVQIPIWNLVFLVAVCRGLSRSLQGNLALVPKVDNVATFQIFLHHNSLINLPFYNC